MKRNLAKVLGLEEYNEEPNLRVEPTEDEVIQIQQDNFQKEMSDHEEATTEALEAIGNAQAFARVIARNNSQDKTAYELLKVAVEQLKEKTGVKTQSVSLESLDKTNYKAEALEDVKRVAAAIWAAIKKAFFAMLDKVKAFIENLFSKNEKIKDNIDEAVTKNQEFVKEAKETKPTPAPNAPETPKQPEVTEIDVSGFKFSQEVAKTVGMKNARDFTAESVGRSLDRLAKELDDLADKIISVKLDTIADDFARSSKGYVEGGFVEASWVSYFTEAKIGGLIGGDIGPSLKISLNSKDNEIEIGTDFVGNRQVRPTNPLRLDGLLYRGLNDLGKVSNRLSSNMDRYKSSMTKFFKEQETIYNTIKTEDQDAQRKIENVKRGLQELQGTVTKLFKITAAVIQYILSLTSGFADYVTENISFFREMIDKKQRETGGAVREKDYDDLIEKFKF